MRSAIGQTSVDFGETLAPAAIGTGPPYTELASQAFNAYDMGVYAAQWVEFVEGARPTTLLRIGWNPNRATPRTGSSYGGGNLNLADDDGYDDANILHEIGHYLTSLYSRSNSPGGSHGISDPYQDARLSWGEGLATWFSGAILQHFGLPLPHVYSDRNSFGTSGGFSYQYETPSSSQKGPAAEVATTAAMWDIIDSSETADGSAGDDDALALPDAAPWRVLRHLRASPPTVMTIEDFWDRWFLLNSGYFQQMKDIFYALEMRYYPDDYEPDDSPETARRITPGETQSRTFYPFPDEDWAYFDNTVYSETQFRARTSGANLGLNNPVIEVFGPDGQVLLGRNLYENSSRTNNQNAELLFVTPQKGRHYIRVTRLAGSLAPDTLYGFYDLALTIVDVTPSITRVVPRTIPAGGAATVSIQGQNFTYHSRPWFGDDVTIKSWEVLYPELLVAELEVRSGAAPAPPERVGIGRDCRYAVLSGAMTIAPSGGVVLLNEIRLADSDFSPPAVLEITNRGPGPQDLSGWRITAARNTTAVTTFDQFAGVTLHPGIYMQVFDTPGTNTVENVYDNANSMQWPLLRDSDGAVELRNPAGELVDYLRFNRNARYPRSVRTEPGDAGWGKPDASGVNSTSTTLARDRAGHDSNQGWDWVLAAGTLGRINTSATFTNTPTPVGYPDFLASPTPTPTDSPTPSPTPTATPTFHPGDINLDHAITREDLFLFAASWQIDGASIPIIEKPSASSRDGLPPYLYGDLDKNGFVDHADLLLFIEYWFDRAR
ncbi:lamin tail domain-containing protein [bacterium]|nr:lamin tail domain-containing protein [bacterium]